MLVLVARELTISLDAIPEKLIPLEKTLILVLSNKQKARLIASIDRRRGVWGKFKKILEDSE